MGFLIKRYRCGWIESFAAGVITREHLSSGDFGRLGYSELRPAERIDVSVETLCASCKAKYNISNPAALYARVYDRVQRLGFFEYATPIAFFDHPPDWMQAEIMRMQCLLLLEGTYYAFSSERIRSQLNPNLLRSWALRVENWVPRLTDVYEQLRALISQTNDPAFWLLKNAKGLPMRWRLLLPFNEIVRTVDLTHFIRFYELVTDREGSDWIPHSDDIIPWWERWYDAMKEREGL